MLKTIRGGLDSILVKILLGVLVGSFAIWGVGDVFLAGTNIVAKVGNREINAQEYMRQFDNEFAQLQAQLGNQVTRGQAVSFGVHQRALGQLVAGSALDQDVEGMGLRVSDDAVRIGVLDIEAFRDPLGDFSRFTYDSQLARAGMSPQIFEAQLRLDLARGHLSDTLNASVYVPDRMVDAIYRFRKESRQARILTIPATAVTGLTAPNEEELRAYYEANSSNFMGPEYRDISFLFLDPKDFATAGQIDEADLLERYDSLAGEYNIPERRNLEVAVFDTERDAQEFYRRVTEVGEDFAFVTEELTGFRVDEINLGDLSYRNLQDDYSEVAAERVFAAEVDVVIEPVATLLAWHVFHLIDVVPGLNRPFEEVRDELTEQLVNREGMESAIEVYDDIQDLLAGGADLTEISEVIGLDLEKHARVDRSGQDGDGNIISTELDFSQYVNYAFSLNPGDEVDVIELVDNRGFFGAQVNEIFVPVLRSFDDVRIEVQAQWFAAEQERIARERATEALAALTSGTDPEQLALQNGGIVFQSPNVQRDQIRGQGGITVAIANLMFALEIDGADIERQATGDGYLIVQLLSIAPGEPDPTSEEYQNLRRSLGSNFANDLLGQYQQALQDDLDVQYFEDVIDQMVTPQGLQLPSISSPGILPQ